MALLLLRVLVLGVLAAAADDVPVEWSAGRTGLACSAPGAGRLAARRPPPPLDAADHRRAKFYTWTLDGQELPAERVSPNGTLEVKRKEGGTAGVYQCAVKHHGGLVLGLPVHLKFASMEKQFHEYPANLTARIGQPVALSCAITSSPAASIAWLRDGEPLPDNIRYHILTNQLLITDVKNEDAGFYRCMATNTPTNKTRISHDGWMQVEASTEDLEPSLMPLHHEEQLVVPKGSSVVLPCPVRGWPRPEVIWEHVLPGDIHSELEVTHEVLVLHHAEQAGVYNCRVAGSDENKTFNVSVLEPVTITIPPTHKEVIRASTVRFNCTATGSPEPSVSWYKDGQKLALAGRAKLLKNSVHSRIDELVISTVTSEDAGIYQCFASNGHSIASEWAMLHVTGAGAPTPTHVRCQPVGDRAVALSWTHPEEELVVAYTVHYITIDETGSLQTNQPTTNTAEVVTVKAALRPYRFQVRAYMQKSEPDKASDMSMTVVCQGQGVPIKLSKLDDGVILVSWREFAEQTPGVKQWMVQYREDEHKEVHNVTLDAHVFNYTVTVPASGSFSVRVLGTLNATWLTQDLSRVPWTSSSQARDPEDTGDVPTIPTELEVSEASAHTLTLSWRGDEHVAHVYIVCYRKEEFPHEDCVESDKSMMTIEGLEPDTEYTVRVQARIENRGPGGAFTEPVLARTGPAEKQPFKSMSYKVVNSTHALVLWSGPPGVYKVRHCAELKLPLDDWTTVEVSGNSVLININPSELTYVMVSGSDPLGNSNVLTIPPQDIDSNIKYEFRSEGVLVSWSGAAAERYWVRYSQEIALPVEKWPEMRVDQPNVLLKDLEPDKSTYVMVTPTGPGKRIQVTTIPPAPTGTSSLYLGIGVGLGVSVLVLLVGTALCIWRRRKSTHSPVRSRRRNPSTNDSNDEEASEMKAVGGRLANGGASRGAGEPLLNGHVHITENPTVSKTPNGKPKKPPRYEPAFDVSRYEDPDATLETVIDADTSTSTQYNLLDTSRIPEYDSSRSSPRGVSANNSFTKLPDDNMNSELTRSTDYIQKDNSKAQPTLQPNG